MINFLSINESIKYIATQVDLVSTHISINLFVYHHNKVLFDGVLLLMCGVTTFFLLKKLHGILYNVCNKV